MLNISQRQLADEAGVAPGTIVSLEKGGMITHESEERVVRYLRKRGIVLIGEAGEAAEGLLMKSPPLLEPRKRGRKTILKQVEKG